MPVSRRAVILLGWERGDKKKLSKSDKKSYEAVIKRQISEIITLMFMKKYICIDISLMNIENKIILFNKDYFLFLKVSLKKLQL